MTRDRLHIQRFKKLINATPGWRVTNGYQEPGGNYIVVAIFQDGPIEHVAQISDIHDWYAAKRAVAAMQGSIETIN